MNLPEPLQSLPDSTPCYVPGVGEVTLGQVRATEEKPALEARRDRAYMIRAVEDAVTRNLCLEPWETNPALGDGRSGGRA